MKIIKEGKIPPPPVDWWVGQLSTCCNCQTVFRIELGDAVVIFPPIIDKGRHVGVNCPLCGKQVLHKQYAMR